MYRWRTAKLLLLLLLIRAAAKEKREEFQEETAKNAEQFSELLEIVGATNSDMERG